MSEDKQTLRERVWDALEAERVARFPFPPHDRIPNFAGAEEAAARLFDRSEWRAAGTVKSNPDAPQLPVRRGALRAGKRVSMAVPRLRDERCFLTLDPATIDDTEAAATISHVDEYATRVGPDGMGPVDLIVAGSVAVTPAGDRIGKGEGYSDLEFAILREAELVGPETTIVTTVHEMQVLDRTVETEPHDVPIDLIVTPERTIETDRRDDRPAGIEWERLDEATIEAIPILQRLRPSRRGRG
ncbi:5-formyltetrahydrofolate cyclo-ligase [Halanaeroarchaeum sp. HSR-CO]|uniref:5-formyltetrahydrofolate cyclo-ligase n=1 Tax=Halanaeroarchaeum sp. HSR-CO TaxID=2866382 RepID=UPI00217D88C7|nr:5-formyltetrahydrofolate cyclo-ligase [Halanaeroarchaeum sp. HSR-CO]UWG48772.1 5-formyltetrahydrofolate cyclo-ligase [Halanaeroarchaeum sp. HSR-CO]